MSKLELKMQAQEILDYHVECAFLEIYLEKMHDLLNPGAKKKLKVRLGRHGHYVQNLEYRVTENADDVFQIIEEAKSNRTVSATKMNATSSRSHMVMMLKVTQKVREGEETTGVINFADLAGSEKVRKTEAAGRKLEEAKKINLSLMQLGYVISELVEGKRSVSYRNSELTAVLQDSLGGNCKTTLVVNCSKSLFNRDETIGTLEFGKRCKVIKNKAKVNQTFTKKELQNMVK